MEVASILKSKGSSVATTPPNTTIFTVTWDLKLKGIGVLVVSDDGNTVLGLISERDIVRGLMEHGPKLLALPVSQVMTSPLKIRQATKSSQDTPCATSCLWLNEASSSVARKAAAARATPLRRRTKERRGRRMSQPRSPRPTRQRLQRSAPNAAG
jgi:CBS domain